jgi:hypothetical protein
LLRRWAGGWGAVHVNKEKNRLAFQVEKVGLAAVAIQHITDGFSNILLG